MDDQLIVDYVNGRLKEADRLAFEMRMAKDETLAKEVALYQDLEKVSQKIGTDKWRAAIAAIGDELEPTGFFKEKENPNPPTIKQASPTLRYKRHLAIAATILLLLVAGFWYAHQNYSDTVLANRYMNLENILSDTRSGSDQLANYTPGLIAIQQNDVKSAISFFEPLAKQTDQAGALFYLGLARYQQRNYTAAVSDLQPLTLADGPWRTKARWVSICALLADGKTGSEFEILLNEAMQDSSDVYYQQEAKSLFEKMNSIWRKAL